MNIFITIIGKREFLTIEDHHSIPVDTITKIDLNALSGVAFSNSVCIHTDTDKVVLSFELADAMREYLLENKIEIIESKKVEWDGTFQ